MTRRLALIALAALTSACLVIVLAIPAEAHARCDYRDHSHRRWTVTRTWVEHWRYLRHDVRWDSTLHQLVATSVWSVGGRTVRITGCGR